MPHASSPPLDLGTGRRHLPEVRSSASAKAVIDECRYKASTFERRNVSQTLAYYTRKAAIVQ